MMICTNFWRTALTVFVIPGVGVHQVVGQVIHEDSRFNAIDTILGDSFGRSVSISGTTAIVAAPGNDGAADGSGSAYLFDTVTGQQLFKLLPSIGVPHDQFGRTVAVSGTTAIVGAHVDGDAGFASGAAYLFDTTTGQQTFKLTASDAAAEDLFGQSVAIYGTIAIVGASENDDSGDSSGSAYLFDTTTGQELFKLTASDAATFHRFGSSVGISGTTAIIGGGTNSVSVYLFDITTGLQLFRLTGLDSNPADFFGSSVAISGTTAIIGARNDFSSDGNVGSAYLFDTLTGQQLFKLGASNPGNGDRFGESVAISGTTVAVGARFNDYTYFNDGSAYIFDTNTGQQIALLRAVNPWSSDHFGTSVAISGSTVIVGAPGENNGTGLAYLFFGCDVDFNDDGELDFFDVSAFLGAFAAMDPIADFTGDGNFDFFDVSAFLTAFGLGCP